MKTLSALTFVPAFVAVLAISGCHKTVEDIANLRGYVPKDCAGDNCTAAAPAPAPAPVVEATPAPVVIKDTVDPDVMPPPVQEMPTKHKKHPNPLDAS